MKKTLQSQSEAKLCRRRARSSKPECGTLCHGWVRLPLASAIIFWSILLELQSVNFSVLYWCSILSVWEAFVCSADTRTIAPKARLRSPVPTNQPRGPNVQLTAAAASRPKALCGFAGTSPTELRRKLTGPRQNLWLPTGSIGATLSRLQQ